jgi:hypothetical protein
MKEYADSKSAYKREKIEIKRPTMANKDPVEYELPPKSEFSKRLVNLQKNLSAKTNSINRKQK